MHAEFTGDEKISGDRQKGSAVVSKQLLDMNYYSCFIVTSQSIRNMVAHDRVVKTR